ncbi:hypothetical protein B0H66DRAFT_534266 [Apodospora peruviana]|uniref:BZIP domain-containing protein n=1 Tax=Apodospora peruviana TaxID=516989 RepID=A0AAE0I008_9PEZI|nr:hypothetical protein B0H66DRAFT_534266 [Apodospora peruviana]
MRYSQGDLAILSAETYDPGLPYLPASARHQVTKKSSQAHGSSVSQDGPRKRAKRQTAESADNDDEEKKRSRGRPRLDIKDETAADRRRTQIRLAQRAYRNRKENAIQTLERRVQELKDTNEEMSNAFMRLHDFAVNNGLVDHAPDFGRQLRATTEKFLALARTSSDDGSSSRAADEQEGGTDGGDLDHDSSNSPPEFHSIRPPPDPATQKPPQQQPTLYGGLLISHELTPVSQDELIADVFANNLNSSLPITTTTTTGTATTTAADYEIITQPTLDNASFPFDPTLPDFNFTTGGMGSPFPSLAAPTSYALQEATFGRRLQRTGIERALMLITMPNPPPKRFNRVFGFCLLIESREAIYKRLVRGIQKTTQENLFNWHFPFFNLGGAGTHLLLDGSQRIGNQGTIDVMKPASTNGFSVGPFTPEIMGVREKRLDKATMQHMLGVTGFGGEFFDTDEVELYLHQRGVSIPPAADFVTVEIDEGHFQMEGVVRDGNKNTNDGTRSPLSSSVSSSSGETLADDVLQHPTWVSAGDMDPALLSSHDSSQEQQRSSEATAVEFGMGHGMADGFPPPPNNTRKMVTVDVNLLVYELTERTVCLGRSPGIKQEDINTAFWKAARVLN